MSYERLWERLLEFLNDWASAREVRPGRIEVRLPGSERTCELVLTRREWEDFVTIPHGDFDLAARDLKRSVLALDADDTFLVYRTYELVPSRSPDLPEELEDRRLQELLAEDSEARGRWIVYDKEGNVLDELRPPAE